MSDINIQAQDSKNESEDSNASKPTQESTTEETEVQKNVSVAPETPSFDEGKLKDDGQEKMDVDEDTVRIQSDESHTNVAPDKASTEEKIPSSDDQSNIIIEDVNMEPQDEVSERKEDDNAKETQEIVGEDVDVDMDKPQEEEKTQSDVVNETNSAEGKNISEDVDMTEEKDTNEKGAAESSDTQPNSISGDENLINKDAEATKDSNASEETTVKAVESAEMDCAENNDAEKTQEVVNVDTVDGKEVQEEAKSTETNENDNNSSQKDVTDINQSQSKDNAEVVSVEESSAKASENKDTNSGEGESSNKDNQTTNEENTNKNGKTLENSNLNDEHSIFVQVNNEKDDNEKSSSSMEQATNEIDPIGSSEWSQNTEPTDNSFVSDLDEADECIIPDANKDDSSIIPSSQESETTLASTPMSNSTTDSDSMRLSEKYLVSVANTDEESSCMICEEKKVCKYNCVKDNDKSTLCSEECLTKLKERHAENVIVRKLRVKNFSTDLQEDTNAIAPNIMVTGKIHCKNCGLLITNVNNSLSWEAFDFCDEQCLTKHQKMIGSYCANCRIDVKENFLGKYCVRFGYNVRQFCSSTCLEQYKKNSKVCSFCQDDISTNPGGFLTSIADKGMAKDFCSAHCMHKYSDISKHLKGPRSAAECGVCHKINTVEIEFEHKNKKKVFCSQPCFVAFKYVNEVSPTKCDMCCKYFVPQPLADNYLIRYDGVLRKFCEKTCQNIYITTNRKIVSCCWCKVKKYNFDMIQKYTPDSAVVIICSLTCLNFFNASVNATKLKKKRCDYCHKICKGQYHITLADDSLKNFCSYPCVQEYQSKYITAPARFTEQPVAMPSPTPATNTRITRKSASIAQRKQIIPDVPGPLPIITSVRSLAPTASQNISTRSLRSKSSGSAIATITTLQETTAPTVRRIVLVRPPDLPQQRNVSTLVKPITNDVEAEVKPIMVDKAVQTEDIKDSLVLLPVPVPIYLPAPMQAFNLTHPLPLPFPLPIPIPMFLPVTKQTAGVVLKETKKTPIQTDPYEADLLMMAELVAVENEKKEQPESEAEAESDAGEAPEPAFSPEQPDPNTTFGDDMLQMALKMASDFDEPAVDLEGALTANTITATPGAASSEPVEEAAPIQPPPVERSTFRGRRRGRPPRHGGRGRGRGRPPTQPEIVIPVEQEPPPPPEPVEKPDANMCLKYTFGVNAWKQWVTTKNAELEKTSRRPKLFKSDILQLTSDELNYSLCLFVKEVRKPNGAEYAPDTIYYLCLGIQQYLFENGRIDNIFCDSYYDSFTDCLDEVCKKFSTLYNDSQYIVTRVEEEHLWESKQLGAHSPHVLLSTLMFFNTKHFNLTNVDEHMQLSFSHIMKHWKRVPNQPGQPKNASSRNILLRFYPPQSAVEGNNRKKKVYEQQENEENPLRCPVKLYEFYLSKCPESVKTRNDVFYLLPERSCVPDSPVWYSTMALGKDALEKMLHRVKMVKEINVALLAS